MKRMAASALVLVLLLAVGCGGDDPVGTDGDDGGGGGGSKSLVAKIDGVQFTADQLTIQVTGNDPATRQGTLIVSGAQASSNRTLSVILSFIVGPATQPLGVNTASTPGGIVNVTVVGDMWSTPLNGASGFVTITARTDKRIAGTFHCTTAGLLPATTPATRSVTEGAFDVTIDAGLPPLPTGVGSTEIATIGGTPFNGATIVGINAGGGVFSVGADNTVYSISLLPKIPVTAGNTYGIPSQMGITLTEMGTTNSWWGGLGADIGSVTITTFNANRLIATFNGTLPALSGAPATMAVTGGAINAYLEN